MSDDSDMRLNEPILLKKLTIEDIDAIRKMFNVDEPKMNSVVLLNKINKILRGREKILRNEFEECFEIMDSDGSRYVDSIKFLDYINYELKMEQAEINDKLATLGGMTMSGYYPNYHRYLDLDNLRIIPSLLKKNGTIHKIYHLNLTFNPRVAKNLKRGIFATTIGKRSIGFWKPDLTMIIDTPFYSSQELKEISYFGTKVSGLQSGRGEKAKIKYDKNAPSIDIVCLEELGLMAVFKQLDQHLSVYDLKCVVLKMTITDLPIELSCGEYIPSREGVGILLLGSASGGLLMLEISRSNDIFTVFKSNSVKKYSFKSITSPSLKVRLVPCHGTGFLTKVRYSYLNKKHLIVTSSLYDERNAKNCFTLAVTEVLYGDKQPPFINTTSTTHFHTRDSINTFHIDESRSIFSGGWDKLVRVWNLGDLDEGQHQCRIEFVGHQSPIVGIFYHSTYRQIISMSSDGIIIIWNYRLRRIIQMFDVTSFMPELYKATYGHKTKMPDMAPGFYFDTRSECLILGGKSLVVIPFGDMTRERVIAGDD